MTIQNSATLEKLTRKQQILQVLVQMLEKNTGTLITTANLAREVGVSEAALYRHFPSKYKMFESLIEFIEDSIFSRVSRIVDEEVTAQARCEKILHLLLSFADKNPGLARLLYGDVLTGEREDLRLRVLQFFDRINMQLKQIFREAELKENLQIWAAPTATAALLVAMVDGKISQFARSNFRNRPTDGWPEQWQALLNGVFCAKKSLFREASGRVMSHAVAADSPAQ